MKTIRSLMLTAVVLALTACASDAVTQQPTAASSGAQSVSGTFIAS